MYENTIYNNFVGGELDDDSDYYYMGGGDEPIVGDTLDEYVRSRKVELDRLTADSPRLQTVYDNLYYTGVTPREIATLLLDQLERDYAKQCSMHALAVRNAVCYGRNCTILPNSIVTVDGNRYLPPRQFTVDIVDDTPVELPYATTPAGKLENMRKLLEIEAKVALAIKKLHGEYISEINRLNDDIKRIEHPTTRR